VIVAIDPHDNARPWSAAVMIPLTAARMISPRTSSMTAAPRMILASSLEDSFRSRRTRAVMPTLVAVRTAPRKT
jgi:hypothetical protein